MRSSWDDILAPGEEIIWQGRPDSAFHVGPGGVAGALFGTFFAGFALFWMIMASGAGGMFWMFGLIHFSAGLGIVFTALLKTPLLHRRTWYSLSNQRAFVATDLPLVGKRLRSFPITRDSLLSLDEQGHLSTIKFATESYRHKNRTKTRRIGFERIENGRDVFALMRDIQRTQGQDIAQ